MRPWAARTSIAVVWTPPPWETTRRAVSRSGCDGTSPVGTGQPCDDAAEVGHVLEVAQDDRFCGLVAVVALGDQLGALDDEIVMSAVRVALLRWRGQVRQSRSKRSVSQPQIVSTRMAAIRRRAVRLVNGVGCCGGGCGWHVSHGWPRGCRGWP